MFNPDEYLESCGGDVKVALTKLANDRARATKSKNAVLEAFGVNLEDSENIEDVKKRLGAELKSYRDLGKPEDIAPRLIAGSTALDAFKSLESDPAKLLELMKGIPARLASAESDAQTLRRAGAVRDVADSYGFKSTVLERLLQQDNLEIAFDANAEREIDRAGKKEKVKGVASVTVDGKPVALDAHASSAWADFLPALTSNQTVPARGQNIPTGGGNNEAKAPKTLEQLQTEKAQSGEYKF